MLDNKALIFILILVFLLRLPSLFEPFTYGDEGIYLTLGQAIRQRWVLYREIHDNKPPLVYLFAALAGNFSYYRLLILGWSLLTVCLFFKLAQQLFPQNKQSLFFANAQNKLAIIVSTGIFAILTSIHTFEGNVGNAENFMLLPIIGGFLLVLNGRPWFFFLSGILFSLAALFKVPAAFDFLAAVVFIFLIFYEKKLHVLRYMLYAIVGFSLPLLITFIYFAVQRALRQYLVAAFFQNIPYLSSWVPDKPQAFSLPLPLLGRTLFVALVVFILFILRKKVSPATKMVLIWFSFSLFAALLSSRPYPHYLLQAIPSFSLSFGLIFQKSFEKLIPLFLIFVFSFSFLVFRFWHYPNLSYYLNFYQFALKMKSRSEYFSFFGRQTETIYQVAGYIQTHTQPQERIFIWGDQPSVYALSQRLPVGRYTVAYHIVDFDGYQETMKALEEKKPVLIIKMRGEKRNFPNFEGFLKRNYLKTEITEEVEIYRRVP